MPAIPAVLVALLLGACGTPPELRQSTAPTSPVPTATGVPTPTPPTGTPSAPAPLAPTPTEQAAAPCRSGPSADQVVSLLRGPARVLPRDVRATVRTGPLCAEDWQYTVLRVTGHEELQVVTRGKPTDLELVTAGTDVCGVEVRTVAPPGIRTLACDGTSGA
ncbi:hypothetical protein ONA91_19080 [Micromonospora sp. DR5-3]|nr:MULTISPECIES: hypothetical protein [unclassified Micromonospora]MCW3816552.1 hypothetical protein [Micromonospora sp. DR5-3]TYC23141.1 hypothetical protein FXF52_17435 [Micromonospora sp. MP36]